MTREEMGVVLANNAAFCRRDADGMLALFAPDAVVIDVRPSGFGEYRGADEIGAYYGGIFDNTVEINEELEVLPADEGVVVAHCRTWVLLTSEMGSGDMTLEYGMVVELDGGRITRLEIHPDGAAALASRG